MTTDCNTTGQENSIINIHSHGPHPGCGLTSPPATLPAPKLCSAGQLGVGVGGRGEEKVHAMVTGRRLGSGSMRNGFCPRCLALCPGALPTLAGGKLGVSVLSVSLLHSLSFWFLPGGPTFVPMVWSILECFGEPGKAVSTMGGRMKGSTYFRQ